MAASVSIVIAIYPGVTQLDFTGPLQVFAMIPGAQVQVASLGAEPIAAEGVSFSELADLNAIVQCDVLCVPGGPGSLEAARNPAFLSKLRELAAGARYVTSVCTGSLILGAAGLLRGKRSACHWASRDLLPLFGAVPDEARVVHDGRHWSGGGVTAGIDFALALAAELAGAEAAQRIQLVLEYAPAPPFDAGRPESAPEAVRTAVRSSMDALFARRKSIAEDLALRMPGG